MSPSDKRRLEKTSTPGIYKRVNADGVATGSYVAIFRAGGKQRRRSAKTFSEAKRIEREAETDHSRGEYQAPDQTRFTDYLAEWVKTYQGTRRGFREGTRLEYARLLRKYAIPYFAERDLKLTEIQPKHVYGFLKWLQNDEKQGQHLSDQSVANAITPVRAALSTAEREHGLLHNPAADLVIPRRGRVHEDDDSDDDETTVKALSREQLHLLLAMTPPRHKLLIELIASTGLRISEAIGLQRQHLHLDGAKPHVKIRRAIVKGRVSLPKTKHGKREVPLPHALVIALRQHLADLPDDRSAVFANGLGKPIDPRTVRRDFLGAAFEEIGAPGLSFHALRHTYTSMQIARGVNIVALSRALGHHSAAFTLSTYAHLLDDDDEVQALDLSADLEPIVPDVVPADLVG